MPARFLIVPGLLLGASGMAWLSQMRVDSPYAAMVLPSELLLGFGMGLVFMPSMNLATLGVAPRETGAAAATINTAQQVGGSFGTALLNTIAASATTAYLVGKDVSSKAVQNAGAVHGYSIAAWVALESSYSRRWSRPSWSTTGRAPRSGAPSRRARPGCRPPDDRRPRRPRSRRPPDAAVAEATGLSEGPSRRSRSPSSFRREASVMMFRSPPAGHVLVSCLTPAGGFSGGSQPRIT